VLRDHFFRDDCVQGASDFRIYSVNPSEKTQIFWSTLGISYPLVSICGLNLPATLVVNTILLNELEQDSFIPLPAQIIQENDLPFFEKIPRCPSAKGRQRQTRTSVCVRRRCGTSQLRLMVASAPVWFLSSAPFPYPFRHP
jgi:hypothetical protein